MSDYVKKKVIRLPFPKNLMEKLNVKDLWDCEDYFKEKFGDLWDKHPNGFEWEVTDGKIYLDYVVDYKYAEEAAEYGFVWPITEEDIVKYKPLFDKGEFEYDVMDLRKVVYCWYNCSEPPDYYKFVTFEEF